MNMNLEVKIIYSKYYLNTLKYDTNNDENAFKKIGTLKNLNLLKSRTICGLHRPIYKYYQKLNNNELLRMCKESIYMSNDAVLKLREHKSKFDKGWWEQQKNTPVMPDGWWKDSKYYKSKKFVREHIIFSEKLLHIKDDIYIFNLIRNMYFLTKEPAIKILLLEILWMSYRINKKLYEYEKL